MGEGEEERKVDCGDCLEILCMNQVSVNHNLIIMKLQVQQPKVTVQVTLIDL